MEGWCYTVKRKEWWEATTRGRTRGSTAGAREERGSYRLCSGDVWVLKHRRMDKVVRNR